MPCNKSEIPFLITRADKSAFKAQVRAEKKQQATSNSAATASIPQQTNVQTDKDNE